MSNYDSMLSCKTRVASTRGQLFLYFESDSTEELLDVLGGNSGHELNEAANPIW